MTWKDENPQQPSREVRVYETGGNVYSSKGRHPRFSQIRLSVLDPRYTSVPYGTVLETRLPGSPFQVKMEFDPGAWEAIVRAEYARLTQGET